MTTRAGKAFAARGQKTSKLEYIEWNKWNDSGDLFFRSGNDSVRCELEPTGSGIWILGCSSSENVPEPYKRIRATTPHQAVTKAQKTVTAFLRRVNRVLGE
jgi:hypothetical protein